MGERTTTGTTPETAHHTQHMIGTDRIRTPEESGPDTARETDGVVVEWNVRTRYRLRTVGLAERVSVDVVVVDRRGCDTTPCSPGLLSVGGHRVLVVPDRRDGAPPVELWVTGGPDRYAGVVRTLRRTVALDASVDAAFEAASLPRRVHAGDGIIADSESISPSTESMVPGFEDVDTALAIGGFAGVVEPLE